MPGVLTGGALFGGFTAMGLSIPTVMNCLIWGSIAGGYGGRHAGARPVRHEAA